MHAEVHHKPKTKFLINLTFNGMQQNAGEYGSGKRRSFTQHFRGKAPSFATTMLSKLPSFTCVYVFVYRVSPVCIQL